ncbi:MAG: NADH:flavin oxidoreductase/NADH oxidase [Candidatus Omnitrophica bacterium]|nr:NADH:flavin oxidoreductase/NADH oxidase [Candidatus Omnitrophota bacterium]
MLFNPLKIRKVFFRNRIAVSPMCQYSSHDGFANDWHIVHYGSRAVGGAALVMTEAAAVEARGRISPYDLGIWKDDHISTLKLITDNIERQGAVAGIQLAHAGRKASVARPSEGGSPLNELNGGWKVVAPGAIPFDAGFQIPDVLDLPEIKNVIDSFVKAAQRAQTAGFRVIELHAAHGYLLHEFLSPVSNRRTDLYGGSFENRTRIVLEVVRGIRKAIPDLVFFVRISATDWLEPEGWTLDNSVALSRILKDEGVDLVDCSSGAVVPYAKIPATPGFQVPFAEMIRKETGILTGAVGLITSSVQAEAILQAGQADFILVGRQFLRDPYWPLRAAQELNLKGLWPFQYGRAH